MTTCDNPDCPDCRPERWPDDTHQDDPQPAWWWPWAVALLLALAGSLALIVRAPTP